MYSRLCFVSGALKLSILSAWPLRAEMTDSGPHRQTLLDGVESPRVRVRAREMAGQVCPATRPVGRPHRPSAWRRGGLPDPNSGYPLRPRDRVRASRRQYSPTGGFPSR